jgi:hypothetical protein
LRVNVSPTRSSRIYATTPMTGRQPDVRIRPVMYEHHKGIELAQN